MHRRFRILLATALAWPLPAVALGAADLPPDPDPETTSARADGDDDDDDDKSTPDPDNPGPVDDTSLQVCLSDMDVEGELIPEPSTVPEDPELTRPDTCLTPAPPRRCDVGDVGDASGGAGALLLGALALTRRRRRRRVLERLRATLPEDVVRRLEAKLDRS